MKIKGVNRLREVSNRSRIERVNAPTMRCLQSDRFTFLKHSRIIERGDGRSRLPRQVRWLSKDFYRSNRERNALACLRGAIFASGRAHRLLHRLCIKPPLLVVALSCTLSSKRDIATTTTTTTTRGDAERLKRGESSGVGISLLVWLPRRRNGFCFWSRS